MKAWMNDQVLDDPTTPVIGVTDHGFTVGDGVFEAVKVVNGQPFALTRHIDRMARNTAAMGLPALDKEAVRRGVAATIEGQDLPLGRIRITLTAGPSPLGSNRGDAEPTLVVVTAAAKPFAPTTAISVVPWPRNERGALAGLKTTSYGENVVALAYAAERGASEAIFVNTQGNLCEGTGSNVFYVIDGELRTPTLDSGCLAGVTRKLILEWAGGREVDEPIEVLGQAEEIFLASTTRDVQPVHAVDSRTLDAPGPITARTAEIWAEREPQDLDP